jgi:hypothetical protein
VSMTLGDLIERVTLLGQLQVQVHEDLLALTEAVVILNDRLQAIEARLPQDRGIGRSP